MSKCTLTLGCISGSLGWELLGCIPKTLDPETQPSDPMVPLAQRTPRLAFLCRLLGRATQYLTPVGSLCFKQGLGSLRGHRRPACAGLQALDKSPNVF